MGEKGKRMGNKLDQIMLERYGVDTAKLAEELKDIMDSGTTDEHRSVIKALAIYIAVSHNCGDIASWIGAAMTLFAIGYKAGKSAPDLSVFEDALRGE